MYVLPKPLEPTRVVAGCIAIYEGLWDDVVKTIQEIEQETLDKESLVKFFKSKTLEDPEDSLNKRTNLDLNLTKAAEISEPLRLIHNKAYEYMAQALRWYVPTYGILDPIMFVEPLNLLQYQGGQEYTAHYDGGTSTRRAISPIIYLNDDYEGGHLEFTNFELKIKPKAGTLVLFPSNYAYTHIAHPVTKGTKYAIVTWLHDYQG